MIYDYFDWCRQEATQKTLAILPAEWQDIYAGILAAENATGRKEALPDFDPDNPLELLNWESSDVKRIVLVGEWLADHLDKELDEWEWVSNNPFCKFVRIRNIGPVYFPSDWTTDPLLHIGCDAFDTKVGRIASIRYLVKSKDSFSDDSTNFDELVDYLRLQRLKGLIYADSQEYSNSSYRPYFDDVLTMLYLSRISRRVARDSWGERLKYDTLEDTNVYVDGADYALSCAYVFGAKFNNVLKQVFNIWLEAMDWQEKKFDWFRDFVGKKPSWPNLCWVNISNSHNRGQFNVPCLTVPPPTLLEGARPVAMAWDVADLRRFAVWWVSDEAKESSIIARESSIIEVYRIPESAIFDPIGVIIPPVIFEKMYLIKQKPLYKDPQQNRFCLHLFGDFLRLIHQDGVYQESSTELATNVAFEDIHQIELDQLSGEVRRAGDQSDMTYLYYRSFRYVDGVLILQYRPDFAEVLPSTGIPSSITPSKVTPLLPYFKDKNVLSTKGPKLVPNWAMKLPLPTPVSSVVASQQSFSLVDLCIELHSHDWEFDDSTTAYWKFHFGTVTAQILQRTEGVVVLVSAYRDRWPLRWAVWPQGSVEEAVEQVLQVIADVPNRLLQEPPARHDLHYFDPDIYSLSDAELKQQIEEGHGETAAVAWVVYWSRLYAFARASQITLPPPPDWNVLRMMWFEEKLPDWVIDQVWDALPSEVQQEILAGVEQDSEETLGEQDEPKEEKEE